jgi:hypothetical protein
MKTIKLFLASSNELEAEREKFEIEVYRKSKRWAKKGVSLHLVKWEDLADKFNENGLQETYNQEIEAADIFVMLAYTKVGKYTAKEFKVALESYLNQHKPFIYTYFKKPNGISTEPSLAVFLKKLDKLKHFPRQYSDFNELWNLFNKELDRILDDGLLEPPLNPLITKSEEPVATYDQQTQNESQTYDHTEYFKTQQNLIKDLLVAIKDKTLFIELCGFCKIHPETTSGEVLFTNLLNRFTANTMDVFDLLLQAGEITLKKDASREAAENLQTLFILFFSLTVPPRNALFRQLIKLPVYTAIQAEIALAANYDLNPEFIPGDTGKPVPKGVINADSIVKEFGWDDEGVKNGVAHVLHEVVHKQKPATPLNQFDRETLNEEIRQLRNRIFNQMYYLLLDFKDPDARNHPLADPAKTALLNADDAFPDLPIVHIGEQTAPGEAKLIAKLNKLFDILKTHGQRS